jgi:NADH dehydrogenase
MLVLIIWAAGVVASPAARWLGDRAGRVKVGPDLSVPGHPEIFVVGDTTVVTDQPGIPGTASPAKQMGRYVGGVIARASRTGRHHRRFAIATWAISPLSASNAAVVKLGRLELTGFVGWLF